MPFCPAAADGMGGLDIWGTWNPRFWRFNDTFRKVHDEHWTDALMNFFWVRNQQEPSKNLLRVSWNTLQCLYGPDVRPLTAGSRPSWSFGWMCWKRSPR